ncbi:hypothetical protein HN51_010057 [Arachis hypogaea]
MGQSTNRPDPEHQALWPNPLSSSEDVMCCSMDGENKIEAARCGRRQRHMAKGKVPQRSCREEDCPCKVRVAEMEIGCGGHRHCPEDRQRRQRRREPLHAFRVVQLTARGSGSSSTGRGFRVTVKTTVVKAP